jgi:hypothetical protein
MKKIRQIESDLANDIDESTIIQRRQELDTALMMFLVAHDEYANLLTVRDEEAERLRWETMEEVDYYRYAMQLYIDDLRTTVLYSDAAPHSTSDSIELQTAQDVSEEEASQMVLRPHRDTSTEDSVSGTQKSTADDSSINIVSNIIHWSIDETGAATSVVVDDMNSNVSKCKPAVKEPLGYGYENTVTFQSIDDVWSGVGMKACMIDDTSHSRPICSESNDIIEPPTCTSFRSLSVTPKGSERSLMEIEWCKLDCVPKDKPPDRYGTAVRQLGCNRYSYCFGRMA